MNPPGLEISVVIPCLNEADTIAICVRKALSALQSMGALGEVVVADNGSTDNSRELAARAGARVVDVPDKGYGRALKAGIAASSGRYIVMGDADDSYDFLELPKFVAKLRQGADIVMGCRLPCGNGCIAPEAMPFLHRYLGNPLFSLIARKLFKCPANDVYCGLRGFRRDYYDSMGMVSPGMEFAIEMVIRASLFGAKFDEVPITLHKDGRKTSRKHLRTFVDGWRTLRLFMLYSPKWIFLLPGIFLILLGLAGCITVIGGLSLFGVHPNSMTLLCSCLAVTLGYQALVFALMTTSYAIISGILPSNRQFVSFYRHATLERGVIAGALGFFAGIGLCVYAAGFWLGSSCTLEDYRLTLRLLTPGVMLACIGFQTVLATFFISMLNLRRQ